MQTIYAAISITAPTLGVITGGFTLNKLGGYDGRNVYKFILLTSLAVNF